jgi:hypothetical protein
MSKPLVITFVDHKMLDVAREQAANVRDHGLNHKIIRIDEVTSYSTQLWLDLTKLTIAAIKDHGKIMRLDAEVRLHKELPQAWIDNDNVLFEPYPIIKDPLYIAINTGQMILAPSGISFLETLTECMLAMIPPDGDTRLPITGERHQIEDELPSGIALRLSKINYIREKLCYDRSLDSTCAANRGLWIGPDTVLTHPALHNWDWPGAGLSSKEGSYWSRDFVNHYAPQKSLREAEFVAKLVIEKNVNANIWRSFAERISDEEWIGEGWSFIPGESKLRPISALSYKTLFG